MSKSLNLISTSPVDRISTLPTDVLCHILSFLPTNRAVATSVLSSRWVNLWAYVSIIDVDDSICLKPSRKCSMAGRLLDVVDRVLSLNQSQTIVKFRLCIHDACAADISRINGCIHNVILRNVVEIDLEISLDDPMMDDDCLKISHSPTLKVLKIRIDIGSKIYVNISGIALRRLELMLCNDNHHYCDAMVEIDAPNLEYLRLLDDFWASYVVKNKPAIREVRLEIGEYDDDELFLQFLDEEGLTRRNRFNELLQGLVNAKFLSVSASTSKVNFSQKWDLPELPCLTKLELDVHTSFWILVLYWLEKCPNLKVLSLVIKRKCTEEYMAEALELSEPDHVPSCLSLHLAEIEVNLAEIEVKRLMKVEEEEMLKYLLQNAKVLDKLTFNSRVYIKDGIRQ